MILQRKKKEAIINGVQEITNYLKRHYNKIQEEIDIQFNKDCRIKLMPNRGQVYILGYYKNRPLLWETKSPCAIPMPFTYGCTLIKEWKEIKETINVLYARQLEGYAQKHKDRAFLFDFEI